MWGATKEVGCGYIAFKNSKSAPYIQHFICNYGAGGNMQGSVVYAAGTTANGCPGGSEDGLCTW